MIAVYQILKNGLTAVQFRVSRTVINFALRADTGNRDGTFGDCHNSRTGKIIIVVRLYPVINNLCARVCKDGIAFRPRLLIRTVGNFCPGWRASYGNTMGLFIISHGYIVRFCVHTRRYDFPLTGRGAGIISLARNGNRIGSDIGSLRHAVRIHAVIRLCERCAIQRHGIYTDTLRCSVIGQRMRGQGNGRAFQILWQNRKIRALKRNGVIIARA